MEKEIQYYKMNEIKPKIAGIADLCIKLEELLIHKDIENQYENIDVFLHHSLIRFNHLLNSVYILLEEFEKKKYAIYYAIYIILRPLMLEYLIYHYLLQELDKKDDTNAKKEEFEILAFDILLDGIERLHNDLSNVYYFKNKDERAKTLEAFYTKYSDFIEKENGKPEIKKAKKLFSSNKTKQPNITASYLYNKIDNKSKNIKDLYFHYNLLSKYEHTTYISYDHLINANGINGHYNLLRDIVNILDKNFFIISKLVNFDGRFSDNKLFSTNS